MLGAAFVFGFVIFIGLALLFIKLPTRLSLTLLGHALWLDIIVTILALAMHWGTMTGLMAAAIAGMMCSLVTSLGRRCVGYIKRGVYHPGWLKLPMEAHMK